jgi:CRISPR/Cas system-associated endoribonuclease Cas2
MTTRLPGVGFIMMLSVMVCLPTPSRLTGLEAQQKGKGQRVQKKAFECTLRSTFFTNSDQE